ncbi:glutamate-1-semialdehyde 2,1-aminomutase [Fulvivirga sedimenti]|uniref:Glutamate-1-semialdehyde 2,1-aminomutase n=1 Tax=Fulvivirga sedimenti TaxID=2879465 RepID=A0A9X1HQL2_9BACT|nr:glutamate-1-semialdehyde 2,1-aminomutase [Fulvivirga sedimenti]MCA6075351.1 glutamate-1-semialdehyde 2,1-aminomutase [Fulvivirga sedimenti]MCA6076528.1 glutamate-1-semialdehyde 2,1-aminomutase [Fulvivirga sedimenti]MCA6077656.1 glutamate-1-semialdehyde 2,1-aminomutase [Fulvivirga sedimenti]
MITERSKHLFEEAKKFIPGGVNSPVRAFKAVGGDPLFIQRAEGAYVFDEDGNRFIELINSWGPMILGHAHPIIENAVRGAIHDSLSFGAPTEKEVQMAGLITGMVPSVEKVRMVNSGTEATMSAIRVARGFTARNKIIKFDGCYHGHGDSFLIAAGSGAMTMGTPDSPGVTPGTAADTLIAAFNDLESVSRLVAENPEQVAAIIVEPVAGNMGCVLPAEGFLEGLRTICDEAGIVLIFDEVMTGFRLAPGGAQERLDVLPDMTTLGKIIGGGMPVGAYGGKKEIMDFVSPQGPVYQAGTLSGNPIAMAAGLAILQYLRNHNEVYSKIEETTATIVSGYREILKEIGKDYTINSIGSMVSLFFSEAPVTDMNSAKKCDTALFGRYFRGMLEKGVYLAPSQFESLFISTAINQAETDHILSATREVLKSIH